VADKFGRFLHDRRPIFVGRFYCRTKLANFIDRRTAPLLLWFVATVFSPFTTTVQPAVVDARKVTVSGVGIKPEGVPAGLPISFKVDTREAGQANLDVVVQVFVYCVFSEYRASPAIWDHAVLPATRHR